MTIEIGPVLADILGRAVATWVIVMLGCTFIRAISGTK